MFTRGKILMFDATQYVVVPVEKRDRTQQPQPFDPWHDISKFNNADRSDNAGQTKDIPEHMGVNEMQSKLNGPLPVPVSGGRGLWVADGYKPQDSPAPGTLRGPPPPVAEEYEEGGPNSWNKYH